MRIGHNLTRSPFWADILFWAVVAACYVWLLGPPADGVEGRQSAERRTAELAVTDSLLYDPEREGWNDTLVSPRRFTVEVLTAAGFPLQGSTQEEVPLAYGQARGAERTPTPSASR